MTTTITTLRIKRDGSLPQITSDVISHFIKTNIISFHKFVIYSSFWCFLNSSYDGYHFGGVDAFLKESTRLKPLPYVCSSASSLLRSEIRDSSALKESADGSDGKNGIDDGNAGFDAKLALQSVVQNIFIDKSEVQNQLFQKRIAENSSDVPIVGSSDVAYSVKIRRGRKDNDGFVEQGSTKVQSWDEFKSVFYEGVDVFAENVASEGKVGLVDRIVPTTQFYDGTNPDSRFLEDESNYDDKIQSLLLELNASKNKAKDSFDSFKEVAYANGDAFSNAISKSDTKLTPLQKLSKVSDATNTANSAPLKALAKISSNVDGGEVQRSKSDLLSYNPIVRYKAESALRKIERRKIKREREAKRNFFFQKRKEEVYNIVDFAGKTINIVKSTPGAIQDVTRKTTYFVRSTSNVVQSIPEKVDRTVKTVKSVPKTINQAVDNTKSTISEIQAIPSKVSTSVINTKQAFEDIGEKIDEVSTKTKVLIGIEKPKPKPPSVPPPKASAQKVALQLASGLSKSVGKLAWFIGKNAVISIQREIGSSANIEKESLEDDDVSVDNEISARSVAFSTASEATMETTTDITVADIDNDLASQVTDALNSAKQTLVRREEEIDIVADLSSADNNTQATMKENTMEILPDITVADIDNDLASQVTDVLNSAEEALDRRGEEMDIVTGSTGVDKETKIGMKVMDSISQDSTMVDDDVDLAYQVMSAVDSTNEALENQEEETRDIIKIEDKAEPSEITLSTYFVANNEDAVGDNINIVLPQLSGKKIDGQICLSKEFDEALARAKFAAEQATRDAEELRRLLETIS